MKTSDNVEAAILKLARERPTLGQAAVAAHLQAHGQRISPSGVRYIWQKHGLETAVKRLQALIENTEEGVEQLTEEQQQRLARGSLTEAAAVRSARSTAGETELPERRQLILTVAAELFSEHGYNGTSIRDIAARVGLLPGSVYHHFHSKDALYLAVHREGFNNVIQKIKQAIAQEHSPWQRLERACQVHIEGIVSGSPIDRITGHHLALNHHDALLARILPDRNAYETIFRELIADLPLQKHVDRSLLRLFLLGGMNWTYLWYQKGRRTPAEIAREMVKMIRNGVDTSVSGHSEEKPLKKTKR